MKSYIYTERDIARLVIADAKTREDVAQQPAIGLILRDHGNRVQVFFYAGTPEEIQAEIAVARTGADVVRKLL